MTAITWSNLREALEEVDAWVALVEKVEATRPTETVLALWDAEAWKMLDYPNWESLCASRGWTRNVLPMIERREMVADLRAEGMSIPAIASATGASVGTIHNDLSALKGSGVEMPETVRSLDGKTRPATQPVRATVEVIEEPQYAVTVNVPSITDEPEAEAVEVLTADEWAERQGFELVGSEPPVADVIDLTTRPHVSNNSGNNEWYTPAEYIEAARDAFRDERECPEDRDDCWDFCECPPITTDPASSDAAQQRVNARYYFTAEDDGLAQQWHGNVWMNPPYSGDLVGRFIDKLLAELDAGRVRRAIVLVNNATETQWAHRLLSAASAVCFPKGRIRYLTPAGQPANTPLQGQMFVYLDRRAPGDPSVFGVPFDEHGTRHQRWDEFEREFSKFGPVVVNP